MAATKKRKRKSTRKPKARSPLMLSAHSVAFPMRASRKRTSASARKPKGHKTSVSALKKAHPHPNYPKYLAAKRQLVKKFFG